MAETPSKRPNMIRPVVLLLVLGTVGFFGWRYATRSEGYTGGDITTVGTVDAVHVQLGFKVGGRLADVLVAEGARVTPGQTVARLETQDLDGALMTATASLEAARAALAQARAGQQRSALELARQLELMKSDATTPQQVDDARTNSAVAVAKVQAAVAQVHQADSGRHQAELQRSYAELHATEAGQVSEKIHESGEIVMVGTPVLTVSQLDTVKVRAAVDETRIGAIRPGDGVRVRVYTFDKRWFDGQVTDIQPAGDFATRKDWGAQRRDIRTFNVTARVPNPDHLLKDGMTAEITIHPSSRPMTAQP